MQACRHQSETSCEWSATLHEENLLRPHKDLLTTANVNYPRQTAGLLDRVNTSQHEGEEIPVFVSRLHTRCWKKASLDKGPYGV